MIIPWAEIFKMWNKLKYLSISTGFDLDLSHESKYSFVVEFTPFIWCFLSLFIAEEKDLFVLNIGPFRFSFSLWSS